MGLRGPGGADRWLLAYFEEHFAYALAGICYGIPAERTRRIEPKMPAPPRLRNIEVLDEERMENYEDDLNKKYFNKSLTVRYEYEGEIAAQPKVWKTLMKAKTLRGVREAYARAGHWKSWLSVLRDHPDKFLEAKRSARYPRSNRPSSEQKRIRYLARAMAGIYMGLSPATSVSLLEKAQHDLKALP